VNDMLYLIGLGINDEDDMPIKAVNILKRCDKIYYENFTSNWKGDIKNLEKLAHKKITSLTREKVESDFLIKEALREDVALLVPGDPLTATTHIELMMEAKKQDIPVGIIHASSIYTAVAETGLQIYKFGRTTTLPGVQEKFKPTSPIDTIKENRKSGLHTLVLLDINMTAIEGLKVLQEHFGGEKVAVCCNLGGKDKIIRYGNISDLIKDKKLDISPSALILPGQLHFKEEEALELWK